MSFNGSGTFVINSAGQPVVANTVISATVFNALTADLATGLSTCITKDGQTTPTANIPMGSNKITTLAAGTAATDAANLGQVQSTAAKLITVTGTDTITGTMSPALTAYATGQLFYFIANGTNTGAMTINIDGLGAKSITRDGSTALSAGDVISGEIVVVCYDGTRFQMINAANSFGNTTINGTLTVAGNTGLQANVSIASALSVGGVFAVTGASTLTGTATLTANPVLSAGTANGVLYLNGSKVATSGSALTFDGTDLATTGGVRLNNAQYYYGKSAAGSAVRLLGVNASNVNYVGSIDSGPTEVNFGAASSITTQYWNISGSEAMRLTSTGLGIGTSSPGAKLDVRGNATFTGNATARQTADFTNTGGQIYVGVESSAGGAVFTGSSAYAGILGTNNATALQLATNGAVRATLDSSGNLGLGVTPSAWGSTYKVLQLPAGSISADSTSVIEMGQNRLWSGSANVYVNNGFASNYYQYNGVHAWFTAPSGTAGNAISFTQAMTLDASGNLGVGTTSPGYRLHVVTSGTNDIGFFGTSSGGGGRIAFSDGNSGTAASVPRIGANANDLLFYTNTSGNNSTERARITAGGYSKFSNNGTYANATSTQYEFRADPANALVLFENRNASTPNGLYVDFSVTSPDNNTQYFLYCEDSTTARVILYSDGDGQNHDNSWGGISDERLKQDIVDANSQWDDIKSLRVRKYRFKSDVEEGKEHQQIGLIAQEVLDVSPGLVTGSEDTQFGVQYSVLYMKAVKALQEAMTRIEQLEAKVVALESK